MTVWVSCDQSPKQPGDILGMAMGGAWGYPVEAQTPLTKKDRARERPILI